MACPNSRIVRWDFSQLEDAFVEYARRYGLEQRGLIPYVADHSEEDLDDRAFTDAINRNLRLGRLLLLIVGDGIREGVEETTACASRIPNSLAESRVKQRCVAPAA